MKYTVTLEDVKQYLNTLDAEDVAGYPWHSRCCLVGNTLSYKYPDERTRVADDNDGFFVNGEHFDFTSDVYETARKFDALEEEQYHDSPFGQPVTLKVLREQMPELF